MVKLLENIEHINILDRWIRVCDYQDNEQDRMYLAERIRQYFPEYRDIDQTEIADSLGALFNIPV